MNYLDILFISIIGIVTIRGLFRGLITELMTLAALLLGFISALVLQHPVASALLKSFPALNPALAQLIAFAAVFIGVNIAARFAAAMLNKIATFTFLQPLNKTAGAVFAFTKITLILSIILMVFDFFPGGSSYLESFGKNESITYPYVRKFAPFVYSLIFPAKDSGRIFDQLIKTTDADSSTINFLTKPGP